MPITHEYTIICDEVRREDNGKLLIVGVYIDSIGLPQLPFVMPMLTFFHLLRSDRPGHWTVNFRLERLEDGQRIVEGQAGIVFQQPGAGATPIKLPPILFQAVGQYNFVLEIQEHPQPILTGFAVTLNPPQIQFGVPPQQQLPFR